MKKIIDIHIFNRVVDDDYDVCVLHTSKHKSSSSVLHSENISFITKL